MAASCLGPSLEEAETIAEWVATEGSGAVLGILEDLLALGPKRLDPLKGGLQIFYVEVEMHRTPVSPVPAAIGRIG
jgi:hypothetical protein